MLHACVKRFDVMRNLKNFAIGPSRNRNCIDSAQGRGVSTVLLIFFFFFLFIEVRPPYVPLASMARTESSPDRPIASAAATDADVDLL
jgi:hypothetical protein